MHPEDEPGSCCYSPSEGVGGGVLLGDSELSLPVRVNGDTRKSYWGQGPSPDQWNQNSLSWALGISRC